MNSPYVFNISYVTAGADKDAVHPAYISGSSSSLKVGGSMEVKCSTFGLKAPEEGPLFTSARMESV